MLNKDYAKETIPSPKRQRVMHSVSSFFKVTSLMLAVFVFALVCASSILIFQSKWDMKSSTTFLLVFGGVKGDSVRRSLAIVTLHPKDKTVDVIEIPDDLLIDTMYGYGQYPSSALYGLMKLDKLPVEFLTRTVSFQFGIPIENVIYLRMNRQNISTNLLSSILFDQLRFQGMSTLSYADRIKLWWVIKGLRKDKVSRLDLISSGMIRNNALDLVKSDQLISKIFPDSSLRQEQISVSVVNTTGESKLGTRVGRALLDMGMNVVQVTDSGEGIDRSALVYNLTSQKDTQTLRVMRSLLGLKDSQVSRDQKITLNYRADVVLLIGRDIADYFHTRP